MSRTTAPIPRKLPSQDRSREMVGRIVDAAGRILVAEGYERASTKRIAAVAGVSPGSVYQYFPNKEAIVVAAVERMVDEFADGFLASLPAIAAAEPDQSVLAMLGTLLDAMERRRELIRVLMQEVPRLGGSAQAMQFERRITDLFTGYLSGASAGQDQARTPAAVWVAVTCVSNLMARYVVERPPIPRKQFLEEVRRLLVGYIPPP